LALPKHERRQYGARTVRQWFRQMRAADFERDVLRVAPSPGEFIYVQPALRPWTLFDTQAVVERERKAFYMPDGEWLDMARLMLERRPEDVFEAFFYHQFRIRRGDPASDPDAGDGLGE
jgi:hypothetical protein